MREGSLLAEPEVSQAGVTVCIDDDVAGLEVAVDYLRTMERVNGKNYLRHILPQRILGEHTVLFY
jgi:hypothetical protein